MPNNKAIFEAISKFPLPADLFALVDECSNELLAVFPTEKEAQKEAHSTNCIPDVVPVRAQRVGGRLQIVSR